VSIQKTWGTHTHTLTQSSYLDSSWRWASFCAPPVHSA